MKALTLTQPWATLIAIGAKRIETRSWKTDFRGPLAIHAAKGLGPVGGKRGLVEQCNVPAFRDAFVSHDLPGLYGSPENPFPLGAIVALVVLDDVRRIDAPLRDQITSQEITPNEIEFGNYETGRFAWFLKNIVPLREPIPCAGALSLWDVPLKMMQKIVETNSDYIQIAEKRLKEIQVRLF